MTREHIEHLLAAVGALGFALFISYFNSGPHAVTLQNISRPHPTLVSLGSTTPAIVPSLFPDLTFPTSTFALSPTSTTPTLSAKPPAAKAPVPSKTVTPKLPAPAPRPAPSPTPTATNTPPATTASPLLANLSRSIVNIICLSNGSLHSISGSGVIIDSNGVILTVAHVAQELLLEEYLGPSTVSCTVRVGSPAHNAYTAKLIYLSSAWVHDNATTLISSQPTGTGENDFALLAITGTTNGTSLPSSFPAIPLSTGSIGVGDTVGIGSYGAQNLSSAEVRNSLYPTLVMSTVKDRYTFGANTLDVLSIAGNAAAQEGSSGGAVVNQDGELVGLITTSDVSGDISSREMRAITPGHIRRSFADSTGKSLESFLDSDAPAALANAYSETVQVLGAFLANALGLSR